MSQRRFNRPRQRDSAALSNAEANADAAQVHADRHSINAERVGDLFDCMSASKEAGDFELA
jgi:hypothetical protein